MATEAQINSSLTQIANDFQSLQRQVTAASQACAIDKQSALAAFRSIQTGFSNLLNSATTLKASTKSASTAASITALTSSITQAISDAGRAQQACQNSQPKAVVNPTNQLQEVKITSKPVAAPDPLQEVNIQSKKNAGELTGVTVTGRRNAAELDTVNIVSKKNPDELQEVTVSGTRTNVQGLTNQAREQASLKDAIDWANKGDWRVRLSLADDGKYLYQAADPGILAPLAPTKGIIFPYTPSIQVSYSANYDTASIQHSNYKVLQYQNSAVENISIGCDFTAQSTNEANYLLAVIHFLRSVTKMFYGKDSNPIAGTPPPLCYLTGLGQYQFNAHPLVITGFTYSLPTDVDYIKAMVPTSSPSKNENPTVQNSRIGQGNPGSATTGGLPNPPNFSPGSNPPTYVPTKININITAMPVVARNVISNDFSLNQYATGALLLGKYNRSGGGIW